MGNVQVMKDAYEAFARGDIEAVLAVFDPEIEWREAEGNPYRADGTTWIGPQAITENLFMQLGSERDGFKATGKRFDAQLCHIWMLRDGNVTGFQQYVDTAQMQEVMGWRVDADPAGASA